MASSDRSRNPAHLIVRSLAVGAVVVVGAGLAVLVHRNGHTAGDDWALYLRQARGLLEGDVAAVIADNRFTVMVSDVGVGPFGYPWGWPIVLSPFVQVFGLDVDQLKVAVVLSFCVWLVLYHGVVRRRVGWIPATMLMAVFATAPVYLAHTDELLSEFAHMAAVGIFIWWYDRVASRGRLLDAPTRKLVVLGLLVTVAFNVRRESLVLVAVLAALMVVELTDEIRSPESGGTRASLHRHGRQLVAPFLAFAVGAITFQWLLPTDFLRRFGGSFRRGVGEVVNENGRFTHDDRLGEYPGILTDQLGLGVRPAVGVALIVVAAIGAVVGVRRRPRLDLALLLLGVFTALALATHSRQIDRYWLQLTPIVAYFVVVAVVGALQRVLRSRERLVPAAMAIALLPVVVVHLSTVAGDIDEAQDFNSAGRQQFGPTLRTAAAMFDAVVELTPPDSVVAYYRARTMTLYTDRLSFQSERLERVAANADFYVHIDDWTFFQPELTRRDARRLGFEEVWSRGRFTIWETGRAL